MQKKLYHPKHKKSNSGCSQCGFHISYHHTFESVLAGEFENDLNGAYTAFRSTPSRASTIESDVLVPLAQSLVWSVVSILPAIPISYWLRYEWYFPFAVGSVSLLISWLSSQKKAESSLSVVEEFSYSPNGESSGKALGGEPQGGIKLDVTDRSERDVIRIQFVALPPSIEVEKFNEFCKGVVLGKPLSRKEWTPERVLFSRDQYDQLVGELMSSGVVLSVDGKGKVLSRGGKRALARYVKEVKENGKTA